MREKSIGQFLEQCGGFPVVYSRRDFPGLWMCDGVSQVRVIRINGEWIHQGDATSVDLEEQVKFFDFEVTATANEAA
jgi:hypothetical protein